METCFSLIIAPIIVGVIILVIEYKTGWFAKKIEHYKVVLLRPNVIPRANTSSEFQTRQTTRTPYNKSLSPQYNHTINPNWPANFLEKVRMDFSRRFNIESSQVEIHGWLPQGITHYNLLVKTSISIEVKAEVIDIIDSMGNALLKNYPPIYQDYFSDVFKTKGPKQYEATWANTFKVIAEVDGSVVSIYKLR